LAKRFHLAWFTNFTAGSWDATFSPGGSPWDGKFYVEFTLALERACFDHRACLSTGRHAGIPG